MAISNHPNFLLFGNGWISGQVQEALQKGKYALTVSVNRIEDREAVLSELDRVKPTHVINTAGARGDPNVDWCETNKEQTIRSNILGAVNLADCCSLKGIHLTHFGSGCIYDYDEKHSWGSPGIQSKTNPTLRKALTRIPRCFRNRWILKEHANVLILRVRNPIAADLHPKNMIVKMASYSRLINVPNSGSILPSLIPAAILLTENNETGVYNFTNPGAFTHNEVMEGLKKHVWPSLAWSNFSEEEQKKILRAPRCNTELDVSKLQQKLNEYGYRLPTAQESMADAFVKIKSTQEAKD